MTDRLQGEKPYELLSFGLNKENDVYPIQLNTEEKGNSFRMNIAPELEFYIPVLGEHNILNAIAAINAGKRLGVDMELMKKGIANLQMTSMRMERLEGIRGSVIVNDAYNASPTSMRAAVNMTEKLQGYRNKFLVLGDMLELGSLEKDFHLAAGRGINPEKVSGVFTYGELGKLIAEGAKERFNEKNVHAFLNKEDLIEALKEKVGQNDFVLVKASRGMKLEQVVEALKG